MLTVTISFFTLGMLAQVPGYTITTVAGSVTGTSGLGDGGAATKAGLSSWGIAVDGSGTLYIADYADARVRIVSPTGIITTFAGGGAASAVSVVGDGRAATSAVLGFPIAVATDTTGNVYIADAVQKPE